MDEERGSAIPESEAVRLGHELYGLETAARTLPGEYDDNFHLTPRNGPGFVLKVLHMQRERGLVDMQCAALQHLATRAPELALPRVIPTLMGEPVATIAGPGNSLASCLNLTSSRDLAASRSELVTLVGPVTRQPGGCGGGVPSIVELRVTVTNSALALLFETGQAGIPHIQVPYDLVP